MKLKFVVEELHVLKLNSKKLLKMSNVNVYCMCLCVGVRVRVVWVCRCLAWDPAMAVLVVKLLFGLVLVSMTVHYVVDDVVAQICGHVRYLVVGGVRLVQLKVLVGLVLNRVATYYVEYEGKAWVSVRVRQGSGHDAQILRSLLRLWLDFVLCAGSSELAVHSDVSCLVTLVFVDGFVR